MGIGSVALRSSALPVFGGGTSAFDPTIESYNPTIGVYSGPAMATRELAVNSKGNVSATFRVPGIISIPSDGSTHNFTIVKLDLDAAMTWLCVPKRDVRVHLKVGLSALAIALILTVLSRQKSSIRLIILCCPAMEVSTWMEVLYLAPKSPLSARKKALIAPLGKSLGIHERPLI